MFTRDIQSKVEEIFDCLSGLKGAMEGPKYKYGPYEKIKKVRLRAVNFFKSRLKDDYVFVNHDPNKARVSQLAMGLGHYSGDRSGFEKRRRPGFALTFRLYRQR